jgi:hypothetical protein
MRAKGKRQPAGGDDEVLPFRARTTFRQGVSLRQQPPPMRKAQGPTDSGLDPASHQGTQVSAYRSRTVFNQDAEAVIYAGRSTA